ncbi:MAG TPA: GH32 C-terminal domain-containing protein, partial [Pirellulales bacterium]|nr:GH32 C-terminal domain-containing protein [Pirellulales bacterium]
DSWNVSDLVGKLATIQVVDHAVGGWGHLNVDEIVQTDRKPPAWLTDATRQFKISTRYLNLPIKNGATKRAVTLSADGQTLVRNDVELADGKADWWAPMDVSAWNGKTLTVKIDRLPEDSSALDAIQPSDRIADDGDLYAEPLRGQLHFSAKRGWNNDPNGMVYFASEYHLFFQHNPYGCNWGNMHWGHAVSKDLVHWNELSEALLPDRFGPMFSGSAVVDHANSSGFGTSGSGTAGQPPLVLIYTAAGDPTVQCLAYSSDGRAFTKFEQNPVIDQVTAGNRDPKVIWHEPSRRWVLALYVAVSGKHTIHIFNSPNLKDWKLASIVEGGIEGKDGYLCECPDFFELPVDGDRQNRKWVLSGANSEYAIGTFDGSDFRPEISKLTGQWGRGFYAPQTFSDVPQADGRRIQIGWFQTTTPGMPFNQSMTIPHELGLAATTDGVRLTRQPAKELESLRRKTHRLEPFTLTPASADLLTNLGTELVEVRAEFEPSSEAEVVFTLGGATLSYVARTQEIVVNGHRAPAPLKEGKIRLTVFVDRTGLEVFAADGLTYVPMPIDPTAKSLASSLKATGGTAKFSALTVYELRSIWQND